VREFELIIDQSLKNGLTPEENLHIRTPYLLGCNGFRCGKSGLEGHKRLHNPLPVTVDMYYNWPFPQFIIGEFYNILVVRDSLTSNDYVYTVSDDHATVTLITTIDGSIFGVGTLMEAADFGEYIFMVNGVVMVYRDTVFLNWTTLAASATIPMMKTVCNFKGQAVGGNITSAWYDCDETFYVWSKIGSIDFTPAQGMEAGYRRCPYGGEVQNVRRLGDLVVGYSSKGITFLMPINEPTTFGFKEMSDIGIINQGAVAGSNTQHVYVGEDYILRSVTAEGIKELGYKYFMEDLSGEDIIVSYDPSNKDFYIGNSTKTFLLSPYGLTEVKQHPSTVWRRDQESYMLPDNVDDHDAVIQSEVRDMEYRGRKTVFTIETDAFLCFESEAKVYWADSIAAWGETDYTPINDMGIASVIASGNIFSFGLKFTPVLEAFLISYIKVRFKMTDLRGIRGVYAPPPRGQR